MAPIVLGIISDINKIANVSTTETYTTASFPNIFEAWAPTAAAPSVLAIVLSIKIEAIDLLMFSLCWRNNLPTEGLSFSKTATYDIFTESKTDSKTEHKNDTPTERRKNIINNSKFHTSFKVIYIWLKLKS